jgi:hypothetical protein
MMEKNIQAKKISLSNTKQEMLAAYNAVLKQLQEKEEAELKPEKKMEERKTKEVVELAEGLSTEGVVKGISNLKLEISTMLTQISDRMEEEVNKFRGIHKAIELKEKEIKELYEIERNAASFAALIEVQNRKRQEFEKEMAEEKEALTREIESTRQEWEEERETHDAEIKERDAEEKKKRQRESEDFAYNFKREQQLVKDKFEDEKTKLEKEIQLKKEEMEKELTEREKVVAEKEKELEALRNKASVFPAEMEASVKKAIQEITEKLTLENKNKVDLLTKEFEGERKMLATRIEALEKTGKEQSERIQNFTQQLEKAYQKVQDIAVKAVEGSANARSFSTFQQMVKEQSRGQGQEK